MLWTSNESVIPIKSIISYLYHNLVGSLESYRVYKGYATIDNSIPEGLLYMLASLHIFGECFKLLEFQISKPPFPLFGFMYDFII